MREDGSPRYQVPTGSVMTVRGPIPANSIGFTLMHEHLVYRFWEVPGRFDAMPTIAASNLADVLLDELREFQSLGGSTVVDATVRGISRDPARLRSIADVLDMHVVMGCGWYREPYYPAEDHIERRTVDELTNDIVSEFNHGVGDSGIRPGIIGEIGTHNSWVSPSEERVHRAAARAALATGLSVSTHSAGSAVGLAQLALFREEGVAPARVIIGHADTYLDHEYHRAIVETGAMIQFDMLGMFGGGYSEHVANAIASLLRNGFADRVLLSHDVCRMDHLKFAGGNGFTYLQKDFLPLLRQRGVTPQQLEMITVANPRRALTIEPPPSEVAQS